ncbi:MAG: 50S ribosomal protein L29 [Desulfopila sp.]
MKAAEIRSMAAEDLRKKEKELNEELANLTFQHRIRPLEDTSRLRKLKKDIARIKTVKNETTGQ